MNDVAREQETQDKVLVVDDDSRLRSLLQRYLEEQGYTVALDRFCSPQLSPRNLRIHAWRGPSAISGI